MVNLRNKPSTGKTPPFLMFRYWVYLNQRGKIMPIKLQLAPPDLQTFLWPWSLNWNLYDARIASDFCPVTKSGINYELIAIGSRWVLRVGFNVDALNKIHAQNFNTTTWSFRVTLSKQNCTKRIVFLAPNYVWTFFYLLFKKHLSWRGLPYFFIVKIWKFDPLTYYVWPLQPQKIQQETIFIE